MNNLKKQSDLKTQGNMLGGIVKMESAQPRYKAGSCELTELRNRWSASSHASPKDDYNATDHANQSSRRKHREEYKCRGKLMFWRVFVTLRERYGIGLEKLHRLVSLHSGY